MFSMNTPMGGQATYRPSEINGRINPEMQRRDVWYKPVESAAGVLTGEYVLTELAPRQDDLNRSCVCRYYAKAGIRPAIAPLELIVQAAIAPVRWFFSNP